MPTPRPNPEPVRNVRYKPTRAATAAIAPAVVEDGGTGGEMAGGAESSSPIGKGNDADAGGSPGDGEEYTAAAAAATAATAAATAAAISAKTGLGEPAVTFFQRGSAGLGTNPTSVWVCCDGGNPGASMFHRRLASNYPAAKK